MSPEQAQGQPLDARTDIFSFGAVLYEMITGRAAFEGTSAPVIVAAIIRDHPKPLSNAGREVPRELERIITRCLRKERDRRFQTAADLKVALEDLREESDAGSPPPAAPAVRRRPRAALLAATLAAVATVLTLGWGFSRESPAPAIGPHRGRPAHQRSRGRNDAVPLT